MKKEQRDELLVAIGERISKRRIEYGYTQAALAEKVDLSDKHLSAIEMGDKGMRLPTLKKICEALQLDYTYLFTGNMFNKNLSEFKVLADAMEKEQLDLILETMRAFVKANQSH